MKLLFPILSLAGFTAAYVDFKDWRAAGPDDARSPCPALNSLANHGILPRDGRNLTAPVVVEALGQGLNVSAEVAATLFKSGLLVTKDSTGDSFDLDDLNKHNALEHDASLSRKDYNLGGESQKFSPAVFYETVSYYRGAKEIGIKQVADARWGRIQSSRATNRQFVYGEQQRFPSHFESSAYFQLFMSATTQKASLDWIKIFFEQERMPYNEGWRPINRIDGFSIAQVVLQIAMHTPEKAPGVGF